MSKKAVRLYAGRFLRLLDVFLTKVIDNAEAHLAGGGQTIGADACAVGCWAQAFFRFQPEADRLCVGPLCHHCITSDTVCPVCGRGMRTAYFSKSSNGSSSAWDVLRSYGVVW